MNQYVTGAVIKELREKNRMTQLQLAEKLGVSDKSVSKWETSSDDMQMRTLYPEGNAEARFKIRGVRRIFFYCNRDGLFSIDPVSMTV